MHHFIGLAVFIVPAFVLHGGKAKAVRLNTPIRVRKNIFFFILSSSIQLINGYETPKRPCLPMGGRAEMKKRNPAQNANLLALIIPPLQTKYVSHSTRNRSKHFSCTMPTTVPKKVKKINKNQHKFFPD
jgi:hypothetical protein